jgi:nucleoside-diphosphate-sugar epimerase
LPKVLVTGGLGFIGTHLVPFLGKKGFDVVSSDIHVRDYDDYVRADITAYEDLHSVFAKEKISHVVHMAGEVGKMVGEEHPQKMLYVNNIGTMNIVKLCLEYKARLVYFSTSEVYGHLFDSGRILKEEDLDGASAFATTNVYAMTKLFGEAIVRHYVDNYGLRAVTVRPFMVYGPGEQPSKYRSALVNFVNAALTDRTLTVHRGAVRAWCYVSDFVNGVYLVLKRPSAGGYEAYNVGSGELRTMEELAEIIVKETGASRRQIKVVDPPTRFLSLSKRFSIEKLESIGYRPDVSLTEGVHRVVAWQRDHMNAAE